MRFGLLDPPTKFTTLSLLASPGDGNPQLHDIAGVSATQCPAVYDLVSHLLCSQYGRRNEKKQKKKMV